VGRAREQDVVLEVDVLHERRGQVVQEAGDWPGNVRELDHVLARAVLRAKLRAPDPRSIRIEAIEIDPAAPPAGSVPAPTPAFEDLARQVARGQRSLHDAVDQLKRDAITAALDETDGNWAEAARRLGMNRSNLHHMAQRLRAQRPPR
jgi:anaerobic nitric oxide reductase transcription regulator